MSACTPPSDARPWRLRHTAASLPHPFSHPSPILSPLPLPPVVHGYVGNKSATFPLQLLGFDVDPLNSVQLSCHTAYKAFRGQVLSGDDLAAVTGGLAANSLLYYSHVLTGYVSSASFLRGIVAAVTSIRAVNPGAVYVCDPVLGDHGKLYVPPELVGIFREEVLPVASVITPNQFEAETLAGFADEGRRITSVADAVEACDRLHALGPGTVIITSSDLPSSDASTMLFIVSAPWEAVADDIEKVWGEAAPPTAKARFSIAIPKLPSVFTGTGDLTAALLLAHMHAHPRGLVTACRKALATVQAVCGRTLKAHDAAVAAIAAAKEGGAGVAPWLDAAVTSASGQMGAVSPVLNELRLVASKADIEDPTPLLGEGCDLVPQFISV